MDWNQESYPQYEDLLALPFFVIFFPAVRLLLDRFVFENLGRRLIVPETKADDQRKKLTKFKESAWKCVYFLSAEVMALAVTYNEPWFTNTRFFWQGPENQTWPDQKYKLKLKGLFMYTGGFYTYSIFSLMFWETRRSDFAVSMGHHIASSFLIVLAYVFRFARVGSVVLALHDATDVFLEVGKMSKYSGKETIAGVSFVLFVSFFFLLRLVYYPFWILRSTSYEVVRIFNGEEEEHDISNVFAFCYYTFNTLLFSLLVLHIYWFALMLKMLVGQIRAGGRVSEDVRSDSEDDEQHED